MDNIYNIYNIPGGISRKLIPGNLHVTTRDRNIGKH